VLVAVRQVGKAPDDVSGIARLPRLGWMSSVGGFFLVLLAIGSVATFLGTLFVGGSANSNVAWALCERRWPGVAVLVLTVFGSSPSRRSMTRQNRARHR